MDVSDTYYGSHFPLTDTKTPTVILRFARLGSSQDTQDKRQRDAQATNSMSGMAIAMALTNAERSQENIQAARAVAPKLSEHLKRCIEFLHKIAGIEVVNTSKNSTGDDCFVLNVLIGDSAMASTISAAKPSGVPSTSFQIQRTMKDFKELVHVVTHWITKHYGDYGMCPDCFDTGKPVDLIKHILKHRVKSRSPKLSTCLYCRELQLVKLPGGLARATMSKDKLQHVLQHLLNEYVRRSRQPRPSKVECQGFDHVSSIVTRFLTRDFPLADSEGGKDVSAEVAVAVAMVQAIDHEDATSVPVIAAVQDDTEEMKHPYVGGTCRVL